MIHYFNIEIGFLFRRYTASFDLRFAFQMFRIWKFRSFTLDNAYFVQTTILFKKRNLPFWVNRVYGSKYYIQNKTHMCGVTLLTCIHSYPVELAVNYLVWILYFS